MRYRRVVCCMVVQGMQTHAPGLSAGGGLCVAHGGGRRCTVEGCDKLDKGGGTCRAHGGARRCQVDGCNKLDKGVPHITGPSALTLRGPLSWGAPPHFGACLSPCPSPMPSAGNDWQGLAWALTSTAM